MTDKWGLSADTLYTLHYLNLGLTFSGSLILDLVVDTMPFVSLDSTAVSMAPCATFGVQGVLDRECLKEGPHGVQVTGLTYENCHASVYL